MHTFIVPIQFDGQCLRENLSPPIHLHSTTGKPFLTFSSTTLPRQTLCRATTVQPMVHPHNDTQRHIITCSTTSVEIKYSDHKWRYGRTHTQNDHTAGIYQVSLCMRRAFLFYFTMCTNVHVWIVHVYDFLNHPRKISDRREHVYLFIMQSDFLK